jgi:hypothetical protein
MLVQTLRKAKLVLAYCLMMRAKIMNAKTSLA